MNSKIYIKRYTTNYMSSIIIFLEKSPKNDIFSHRVWKNIWSPLGGLLGGSWEALGIILGASWAPLGASWLGPWPRDRALRGAQVAFYQHKKHTFVYIFFHTRCEKISSWKPLERLLDALEASKSAQEASKGTKTRSKRLQEAQIYAYKKQKTYSYAGKTKNFDKK